MTIATERTYRPLTAVLLSVLVVAVAASVANALIAVIGRAVGARDDIGLQPMAYLSLTIVAAIGGAIGWHLVNAADASAASRDARAGARHPRPRSSPASSSGPRRARPTAGSTHSSSCSCTSRRSRSRC